MTFTLTTGNNANSILIIINPITVSHGIIIKLTLILIENTISIHFYFLLVFINVGIKRIIGLKYFIHIFLIIHSSFPIQYNRLLVNSTITINS